MGHDAERALWAISRADRSRFRLAPGNVEWHYPQVRKPKAAKKVQVETRTKSWVKKAKKPKPLSPAQKRATEKLRLQAEKQAKREALAAEFMRWERLRKAG